MKRIVDVEYDAEARVLRLEAPLADVQDHMKLRVVIEQPAEGPAPDDPARREELIALFGVLRDDPLERPPQGDLGERDSP
ncbi:MAG TPA: hypothetical protein VHL58_20010 [Thermoanaerobaculia bacterium]|nr:hypothetical protein [Thermoanaerobaculia bacterium]